MENNQKTPKLWELELEAAASNFSSYRYEEKDSEWSPFSSSIEENFTASFFSNV